MEYSWETHNWVHIADYTAKEAIKDCPVHKKAEKAIVGRPSIIEGKCEGYDNEQNETHDDCKTCGFHVDYDEENK